MNFFEKQKELEALIVNCGDGNCIFRTTNQSKAGQHTNGGCHCLDSIQTPYSKIYSRFCVNNMAKVCALLEQAVGVLTLKSDNDRKMLQDEIRAALEEMWK